MDSLLNLIKNASVEWKTLAEISNKISSGGTPKTGITEYYDGDIPWLRTQEVDFGEIWDTGVKITETGVKNSSANWIPANCIIIAMYGATVGKIGINKIPMTTNQACANIEINDEIANYRYVFHCLMAQYEYIKSLGSGSQTNINAQIVKNLKIPIPSKKIQEKIVKVLDKMIEYVTELTAELTARNKQYTYYRDLLLNEENLVKTGFEWKTLDQIATNHNSKRIAVTKGNRDSGIYPYYGASGITDYVEDYIFDGDYLLISEDGANLFARSTPIAFSASGKFWVNNHAHIVQFNTYETRKFVEYYFSKIDITKYISTAAQPKLTKDNLNKIPIPIPSPIEQTHIVEILDKFDALATSISVGLPKEIELRQKQYEYYRDLLLGFSQE